MQQSEITEIANKIHDFLKQPNCVVWIGAGLSRPAGYPEWGKLIEDMCSKCKVSDFDSQRNTDTGYLQNMADICKDKAPIIYRQYLSEVFGAEPVKSNFAYNHLLNLDLHAYITTNFDPLLATTARTRCCSIFDYPDISPRGLAKNGNIFYIHGRAQRKDSNGSQHLVLSTREFEDAYNGATWCFLYDLLTYFPILFVGYQIGENQVEDLIDIANKAQGLIQSTDESKTPPRRAILLDTSPVPKDDREDVVSPFVEKCSNLRVEVIEYEKNDDQHSGLVEILAKLGELRENVRLRQGSGYSEEYPK